MNVNGVSAYLQNKEYLKTVGFFLGWIGLLGAVFMFLLTPQTKKIHMLKDKLAMLEVKSLQYSNFKEFNEKLEKERERIISVIHSVSTGQILTDKTDQSIFAAISRICVKADINLDKVSAGKSGDGQQQGWNIAFKASYDKLITFLFLLEQSFKIDTFSISSGRDVMLHQVTMIVYPVTVPEATSATSDGKDLFDLYNDVDAALTKLEGTLNANRSNGAVGRDPMLFREDEERKEPKGEAIKEKTPLPATLPPFVVEDIFWDTETPLVAIDGKVCKEGETFRDFQIVKIREKNVDIKWRSRVYTLEAGNNKEVK